MRGIEVPIYISLLVGILVGFIAGLLFGDYFYIEKHNINSATNGGFSIGSGVLLQEWHCQPIQKVQTLEEAKALIDGYHAKAMVRG